MGAKEVALEFCDAFYESIEKAAKEHKLTEQQRRDLMVKTLDLLHNRCVRQRTLGR